MCWQCDNPDATVDDYLDLVREQIELHGWFVQGVEAERHRPGFAYTVGLTDFHHSELLITGLPHEVALSLLDRVAHDLVAHGCEFLPGEQVRFRGFPRIEVVEISEPAVHLRFAAALYGPEMRAQQLVYADDHGNWPWAVGFRGRQPVLGERATAA